MRWVQTVGITFLCVGFAVPGLTGCATEDEVRPGALVVPFELGNGRSCEQLGIVAVRAELDDGDFVEEVDCELGELRVRQLLPGRYSIRLYGLNEDDVPVMDSLAQGAPMIDVIGDNTTVVFDPPLSLTAAPARLELRWAFGFGSCDTSDIDGFEVAAWRRDGSSLLMVSEVACREPGRGRGQYRGVPDESRELSGDEVGEVEVQPLGTDGHPVGEPAVFTFDSPGAGRTVRLSLECASSGCDGSGTPD